MEITNNSFVIPVLRFGQLEILQFTQIIVTSLLCVLSVFYVFSAFSNNVSAVHSITKPSTRIALTICKLSVL